ncbi:MAG TPA: transporter substrate-binding domain-containing protein [Candidatus Binatia bacterium]|nr:transporter substrate-binding domain-containing protein [Candidatus Binatia bacterium]
MKLALLVLALAGALCLEAAQAAERKVLRVGTSGDYAPFSVRTASDGAEAKDDAGAGIAYSGFDIEVARRFAGDHGYAMELVPFRWPELSRDLSAGKFDVAMGGVTVRGDRAVIGGFTIPVVLSHAMALAWKGAGIDDVGDLNRRSRRIAVNAGGYLEGVAKRTFFLATVVPLPDNRAVHMALMDRWTDAVVTDSFEEKAWTATARDVVRIGPLSDDRKAYLVRADRADLLTQLNDWLLRRERDGSLARMRSERLGPGMHAATAEPLAALVSSIVERMAMMPLVYAAKREAKRTIEDKAQESKVLEASVSAAIDAARHRKRAPSDAGDVQRVFKVLIEAGKDVQLRLAEEDRQRRQVKEREAAELAAVSGGASGDGAERDVAGASNAGGGSDSGAGGGDGAANATGAATAPLPLSARLTGLMAAQNEDIPLYDLDTQLRPALARVTAKVALLLVVLDKPLTVEAVHVRLAEGLSEQRLSPQRLQEIAEAITAVAASNAASD